MTLDLATVDAGLTDRIWVSIAEAARQQTPPVSRAAMHKRVTRLVEAGRLSTRPGERGAVLVNIVALNRAIASETDPAQALRNGRAPEPEPEEPETPAAGTGGSPSFHTARANRESYQAENARLDLEERLGRLADKADVAHHTMTVMRFLRDRLMGIPARTATRLASAPDATAIRTILQAEMRAVLDATASRIEAMAAGDDEGFDDGADGGEREADQGE